MAWLPDKGQFYATAHRYDGPLDQGKHRIATAFGNTADEAIRSLAAIWQGNVIAVSEFLTVASKAK